MRLKFKDSPPTNRRSAPKGGESSGIEELRHKCGHVGQFHLYAKDPFRGERRLKELGRACPSCRKARAEQEAIAGQARRAERAAKRKCVGCGGELQLQGPKKPRPRLPNGAHFAADYDAAAECWTGALTIDGVTYEQRASGIRRLLQKLDDAYRKQGG